MTQSLNKQASLNFNSQQLSSRENQPTNTGTKKSRYPIRFRLRKNQKQNNLIEDLGIGNEETDGVCKKLEIENRKLLNSIEELTHIGGGNFEAQRQISLYQVIMEYRQKISYLQTLVFSLTNQLLQRIKDDQKKMKPEDTYKQNRGVSKDITKNQQIPLIECPNLVKQLFQKYERMVLIHEQIQLKDDLLVMESAKAVANKAISNDKFYSQVQNEYFDKMGLMLECSIKMMEFANKENAEMQEYIIRLKEQLQESKKIGQKQIQDNFAEIKKKENKIQELKNMNEKLEKQIQEIQNKLQKLQNSSIRDEIQFQAEQKHKKMGNILKAYKQIQSMYELNIQQQSSGLNQPSDEHEQSLDEGISEPQIQSNADKVGDQQIDEVHKSELSGLDMEMQYLEKIYKVAQKSSQQYEHLMKNYQSLKVESQKNIQKLELVEKAISNNLGPLDVRNTKNIETKIEGMLIEFEQKIESMYSQRQEDFQLTISEQLNQIIKANVEYEDEDINSIEQLTIYDKIEKIKEIINGLKVEIRDLKEQRNSKSEQSSSQQEEEVSQNSYSQEESCSSENEKIYSKQKLIMSSTSAGKMIDTIQKIENLMLENEQFLSSEIIETLSSIEELFKYLEEHENQFRGFGDTSKLKEYLNKLEQNILKLRESTYFDQYQQQLLKNSGMSQEIKKFHIESNIVKYRINCLTKYLIHYDREFHKSKKTYDRSRLQTILIEMLDYLIKQTSMIFGPEDRTISHKIIEVSQRQKSEIDDENEEGSEIKLEGSSSILKSQRQYKPEFSQLLRFLTKQFEDLRKYNFPNAYELIQKIEMDIIKISQAENNPDTILHYCKKIFKILEENEQKNRLQFQRRQKIIKYRSNLVTEICKKGSTPPSD